MCESVDGMRGPRRFFCVCVACPLESRVPHYVYFTLKGPGVGPGSTRPGSGTYVTPGICNRELRYLCNRELRVSHYII